MGSGRRSSLSREIAVGVLVVLAAAVGPRLMDARAALLWTRHHAARVGTAARPAEHARGAAGAAARAIRKGAPLPWAGEAARLALGIGREVEEEHPAAALHLYSEVRKALDESRASFWRGVGLSGVAEEARALEEKARGRPSGGAP